LWGAYKSWCTGRLKKPKYTRDQLEKIIDKMTKRQSEDLVKAFMDARVFGKTMREYSEEGTKKK
jgi:hypothetical protein